MDRLKVEQVNPAHGTLHYIYVDHIINTDGVDASPGQSRTAVRAGQSRRKRSHREALAQSEEDESPDDTQRGGGEGIQGKGKSSSAAKSRRMLAYRKESPVKTSPQKKTKVRLTYTVSIFTC